MSKAFFAWGVLMLCIGIVGVTAFGFPDPSPPALFFGTAGTFFAIALFLSLTRFGTNDAGAPHSSPDISPPMPLLALAIAWALVGATVGWWLSLIGAGMALFALGGALREWLAQRRTYRRAIAEHGSGFGEAEGGRR